MGDTLEIHGRYMGDIWEGTCAAMAEDERWRRAWASSEAARRQYDAPGASQYDAEGAAARGRSPVLVLVLGLELGLGLRLGRSAAGSSAKAAGCRYHSTPAWGYHSTPAWGYHSSSRSPPPPAGAAMEGEVAEGEVAEGEMPRPGRRRAAPRWARG